MSKLDRSLRRYNQSKEDKQVTISGTLGMPLNGQKTVEVPGRRGFVFVKLKDNTSEIIQAYNSSVSNTYDLPVLVTRQNNIYRVIGRNLDLYRDWGNIPYLPKHGGQHSFNPVLSMGADITWVYSQQIMPLLGYPSGTNGSPTISIAPQMIRDLAGNWKYVGNTGTESIIAYNPNTGSRAMMALVYLDTVSGNPYLLINSGTYFPDSLTGTNEIAPYIPRLESPHHLPIVAVRLVSGTSGLTWNNLYDARPFLQVIPTGSSGASGFTVWDEGVLKGTANILNVVGLNADISISGSVARLFITGSNSSANPPVTGTVVLLDNWATKGSILGLNFAEGLYANLSGSYGDVGVEFGTGTFQVARGNRGVTNGDSHDHIGGDGNPITPAGIGATPNDGWVADSNTWTRTGNYTFTVSGDVTTTYRKGSKVRYKDGSTYEYGVIYSSSHAAGTTTVTLITNSNYAMAAATITDTYLSYIENPEGFPDWFSYTVSWTATTTNPVIGDGTLYGKWKASGKSILAKVRIIMGSTTTYGTGNYNFSIPCNSVDQSSSVAVETASGNVLDSDTLTRYACNAFVRTSEMRGLYQTSILGPTAPITFAQSDVINLSVEYEY